MAIDKAKIEKWFSNQSLPSTELVNDAPCQELRLAAKKFADTILDNTPASADQSSAIRYVRQALQWSVEAIIHESN